MSARLALLGCMALASVFDASAQQHAMAAQGTHDRDARDSDMHDSDMHGTSAASAANATAVEASGAAPSSPTPADAGTMPARSVASHAGAMHMDDDPVVATLRFDRLESGLGNGGAGAQWELAGWAGTLERRAWLRSEGGREGDRARGDVELLLGAATGPWWDRLIGLRHDFGSGPARDWLAVGVQGLAPYKFEVAATAYLGSGGRTALRLETEYDVLLSNRWILQPRAEVDLYGRSDPARGVRSGLGESSLGLRLRYELSRQFAPYVGYAWTRRFGDAVPGTARGDDGGHWVAGVRFWF